MVDSQRHILLASVHHSILDGFSAALLQREVALAFNAALAGAPPPWEPLPVQLVDYAAWQRRHLSGAALEAQLTWWTKQLAGAPPLLELPWDRPRPEVASHAGAAMPVHVPPEVAARLRELAASEGITLFSILLTAIQASSTIQLMAC